MDKSSRSIIGGIAGLFVAVFLGLSACKEKAPVPKPKTYLRPNFPEHSYTNTSVKHPCFSYRFDLNSYYSVGASAYNQSRAFFYFNQRLITPFNARQIIELGPFNGRLELFSFVFPSRDSLNRLINFSNDLVDEDKIKADSINFSRFLDPEHRIFGTFYKLYGNVANNFRFHITDSVHRFVLGNVMLDCPPNYDSLQPSLDYIKEDLDRFLTSFRWNP
ncbi:MAG: hypothetical protein EBR54_05525 [Flavobacteriia bacterium]|nr:hypothetical protein [Flavobacteriia bacterium]